MLESLILLTIPVVITYFLYVVVLELPFMLFGYFARKLVEKEEHEKRQLEMKEVGIYDGNRSNSTRT